MLQHVLIVMSPDAVLLQIILDSGALQAALRILGDRGHQRLYSSILPAHFQPSYTPDGRPLEIWEAAQAIYNTAVAAGLSGAAASSAAAAGVAAAVAEGGGRPEQQRTVVQSFINSTSQPQASAAAAAASSRPPSDGGSSSRGSSSGGVGPSSSAVSSSNGGAPIGPAMVLEQAAGVVCMLSHNLDNHFRMVGEGVVPLLVSLLHRGGKGCLKIIRAHMPSSPVLQLCTAVFEEPLVAARKLQQMHVAFAGVATRRPQHATLVSAYQ